MFRANFAKLTRTGSVVINVKDWFMLMAGLICCFHGNWIIGGVCVVLGGFCGIMGLFGFEEKSGGPQG